ncbi:hypothetical protein DIURU_003501 [Diutina rugosa]|uniref:NAD(P)-binding domain-containing protein n=1 Tax=Diutina rugosa TaxID=5481 RepID=A0A642UL98_DIURU|nr:uncharacterized protein DIURU_003501 [Diutina rugosa]KAA8901131.1 hypothetical protein DIURU_003501 [Diutina rugosa]
MEYILVTGGAGYIGSHTTVELINNGYNVVIVDNLCNSSYDSVARIEYIVGKKVPFVKCDLRDTDALSSVFEQYKITGVIHFAALKAVGESVKMPLAYYENNLSGTVNLLEVMKKYQVKTIVFSSSATVYGDVTRFGDDRYIPIPEDCPMDPTNPYGRTKFMMECILKDIYQSEPEQWRVAILRYFNPIGAHPSGIIGEDPLGIPNNLLPFLAQVAIGRQPKLRVFGSDYNSHDGTPIRDYIHVVDLAKGHIAALNYLEKQSSLYREWNLGSGKGSTVFDVYHAFCKAAGMELPYEVVGRRAGDVLDLTANPTRANKELEWKTELTVDEACVDLWRWTTQNPYGYNIKDYKYAAFDTSRIHHITKGNLDLAILNYGATIQSLKFNGQEQVLGFNELSDYQSDANPYFGATIGRYANRIKGGEFTVDGSKYQVTTNNNNNCLHGGSKNTWNKAEWFGPAIYTEKDSYVLKFKLVDSKSEDGFPGAVEAIVTYTISESNKVSIEYQATTGTKTPLNVTNHTYFAVDGSSTIDDLNVTLNAPNKLKLESGLPTGTIEEAKQTELKPLKDVKLDDYFVVSTDSKLDTRQSALKQVVRVAGKKTTLIVSTTEPGFQVYTGDFINVGDYKSRSGLAIEPSRFVDAINNDQWSSQVLVSKGETYGSKIEYHFS